MNNLFCIILFCIKLYHLISGGQGCELSTLLFELYTYSILAQVFLFRQSV